MTALILVSAYLLLLAANTASARGEQNHYVSIDHHSAVLMWLVKHPRPGTLKSRAYVWHKHMSKLMWKMGSVKTNLLCIHPHEGSWTNPNYGGLGLMHPTQRMFGPEFRAYWGDASHWPPWAQLVAGYRCWAKYHSYSPWTSRGACGL